MPPVLALTACGVAVVSCRPLTSWLGRAAGWPLAVLYLLGAAALVADVASAAAGMPTSVARIPWVPARGWTLDLVADPTGLLFAVLALVVGAVVLVYSTAYLSATDDDGRRVPHHGFYQLMTLFTLSMLGLVLTDSLVLLFVCWELTSLASFALIANSGRSAYPSALRTLVVTFLGGLALLVAVVAIALRTGTASVHEALSSPVWWEDPGFATAMAVLVAVAAFTKSAQFPFHFWLPDAMAAVTPVSAYLHAAAVVKAGIFLLMRFSPAFHQVPTWRVLLVSVGMGTAVMAALFALQKTDLKQLMAYSTVSQLGWIVAAIGVGTPFALSAAALHTVAHALFKSGLFMLVGVVDHEAGSRDLRRLGPLWRRMPWTFGATVLGAAAMAGIPPTLGFVSKESILTAFGGFGSTGAVVALTAAAVLGAILTFAYCARIVLGAFVDGPRDLDHVHEAPVRLWLPAALPAVVGLPLALVAWVFDEPLSAIARQSAGAYGWLPTARGSAPYREVRPGASVADLGIETHFALWHGLTVEIGLTALIFAVGCVLVWRRRAISERIEGRELLPFTGPGLLEKALTALTRAGRALARPTASDSPTRHIAALIGAVLAFAAFASIAALTAGAPLPARIDDLDRSVDVVVLVVVAAAVVGLCAAPSRIASVVLLSAVGIAVTVQILGLGAPDVGLTQLLVEALTVIVVMLVLRRLPGTFLRPSRRRRNGALALAVASGVAASAAVLVFTARRERSDLGRYLLENTYDLTGGHNVVNVILVEFRALDTFGEVAVLGVAGLAVVAVLSSVRTVRRDPDDEATVAVPLWRPTPGPRAAAALADAERNTAALRLLSRAVSPVLVVVSLLLLWRGHNAPGGGFIAALVASCAVALHYLSRSTDTPVSRRATPVLLIGGGLLLAGLTGVAGYLVGTFLTPAHTTVAGQHLSSALVFDIGVFAGVLGLVLIAVNVLGTGRLRAYLEGAGAAEGPVPPEATDPAALSAAGPASDSTATATPADDAEGVVR